MPRQDKSIERLSMYRRILHELQEGNRHTVYSHDLGRRASVTPAQVRKDLTTISYNGVPRRGYEIDKLVDGIDQLLAIPQEIGAALVGVGNLGRALLAHFASRPNYFGVAFDSDAEKCGRVVYGCRCHPMDELETIIHAKGIRVAVIAVPPSEAQAVADRLVLAGVRGILNFAPVPLRLAADAHLETIDIAVSLEKVAFYAQQKAGMNE